MRFHIIHALVYTFKCKFLFIYTHVISTFWVRGICQALHALVLSVKKICFRPCEFFRVKMMICRVGYLGKFPFQRLQLHFFHRYLYLYQKSFNCAAQISCMGQIFRFIGDKETHTHVSELTTRILTEAISLSSSKVAMR